MALTRTQRLPLCALAQPGWGGMTLAEYAKEMERRPESNPSEAECAELLARFVAGGYAVSLGGDPERWELTETAHALVVGPPEDSRTDYTVEEVMLAFEPGSSVGETGPLAAVAANGEAQ